MTTTLTIRGLAESVKHKLRIQAASRGRSMEAEVRDILTRAVEDQEPAPPRTVEQMTARLEAVTGIWKDRTAGKSTDEIMQELRSDD
jgi:plasmid stability protein